MEQTSWIRGSGSQKAAVASRWDGLVIAFAGAKQWQVDWDQLGNLALQGKKLPSRMAVAVPPLCGMTLDTAKNPCDRTRTSREHPGLTLAHVPLLCRGRSKPPACSH